MCQITSAIFYLQSTREAQNLPRTLQDELQT